MTRAGKARGDSPTIAWRSGWRRLTRLWRFETAANVDDELRFHFEQKVAEFVEGGMSEADARARADEEFGDVATVRESLKQIDERVAQKQRRAEWWESFVQDVRYVLRSLRRSPMFTATVVVTLALGLGANAAIFSLLDRLYVQKPAGAHNAVMLQRVHQFMPNNGRSFTRQGFSFPEIRELRRVAPEGFRFAAYRRAKVRLGRAVDAPEVNAAFVEGDYFGVSGVRVLAGRLFSAAESRIEGLSMVAVISESVWRRHFNREADIIGRDLDLGGHRHVIVGVVADNFRGLDLDVVDVWAPLNTDGVLNGRDPAWFEKTSNNGFSTIAYVPGVPQATLFNARATEALRKVRIGRDTLTQTFLSPLIAARGGEVFGKELAISTRLAGVALVILLIACANVINLMLSRAATRQREVAVRLALGISRRRLFSQLLLESGVLALLSAMVALAVAYVATGTLRTLLLPDVQWGAGVIDNRATLFTIALALVAGFGAGLVPALQSSRPNLSNALKTSVRDGGHRKNALRSTLLVMQAALSVVLIVGAGVFVRSLRGVEAVDTGFKPQGLLYATIRYNRELGSRYEEITRRLPDAADRVRRVAGVELVAMSSLTPMSDLGFTSLHLPDRDSLPKGPGSRERFFDAVSPEFFTAVGMPLLKGRAFAESDRFGTELVAIVDRNMADDFWPGKDPLTQCIIVGKRDTPCRRVVGVVAPSHWGAIIEDPSQHFYVPLAQAGDEGKPAVIVVRTAPKDAGKVGAVVQRELVAEFGDWSRPRIQSMAEILEPDLRPWRVGAQLFTAAGLLALLVAAVGVYSSISYTISQRTQEMGVRVALGANSSSIMRLVIRESVGVVAIGVTAGLLAALALGKVVASMLFETSPRDPMVLGGATLTLLIVALIASAIPAWRASRVDPLTSLRAE